MEIEVREREVDDQPVRVLGDAAISNFRESEDALDDMKRMLAASTYAPLCSMGSPLALGQAFGGHSRRNDFICLI